MEKGFILFKAILFRKRLRKDYFYRILIVFVLVTIQISIGLAAGWQNSITLSRPCEEGTQFFIAR